MTDDLLPVLTRFHREVVMPDMQRLVGDLEKRMDARFDEVNGRFDDVCHRFERLETEYRSTTSRSGQSCST